MVTPPKPLPVRQLAVRQYVYKTDALSRAPLGHDMAPRQSAPRSARGLANGPSGTALSECSSWYAKAIGNPFGTFDELPCIPVAPACQSQKWRSVTRGTFVTGTAGYGFVGVSSSFWPNDVARGLYTSGATFAGGWAASGTGVTAAARSANPYTSVSSDGISGRLVGLGLRTRNITKALNVGGILAALQGSMDEFVSLLSAAQVFADARAILVPQVLSDQSEWSVLNYRPLDLDALGWIGQNGDRALQSNVGFDMGFLAQAPSTAGADAQTFEYEIIEFWEFMGQSVSTGVRVPTLTRSDADEVGLDRVLAASAATPNTLLQRDWTLAMAEGVVESVAHSDTVSKTVEDFLGLAGVALPMVSKMVSSLTSFLSL